MAKEDKPLEYERRQDDTKTLAQRLVLPAYREVHWLRRWKLQLAMLLPAVAALGVLPFLSGIGQSRKIFSNGPISKPHAVFESKCAQCHTTAFQAVTDNSCKGCHDGPAHQANTIGESRCAECHREHTGEASLKAVRDVACTRCHEDLPKHGKDVKLAAKTVTAFARGRHPELTAHEQRDERPLKLNHAVHMPAQPKTILGIKLPMKCVDCHTTGADGELVAMTFDQHCASCHKAELGFDVYQVLGAKAGTAPHSKDPAGIRAFVREAYASALQRDPGLAQRPLGRNVEAGAPRSTWLETAVADSTEYLFEKKCRYCHEVEVKDGLAWVAKVGVLKGRFVKQQAQGPAWAKGAHFRHRPHRMVQCASCHTESAKSVKTADILIPKMESCLPCHGQSGISLDNCAGCHYYHDKTKEKERDRKTVNEIIGRLDPGLAPLNRIREDR